MFLHKSVNSGLALKLFVNNVEAKPISSSVHLSHQVSNLLDGLNLLLQEFSLQEVSQLSIRLKKSLYINDSESLSV